MISYISDRVLLYIKRHQKIDCDMAEVYKYGIEITLSSVLNIVLIILFAAIIGNIVSGIIYLLCMISLRSYCGGYHASTYLRCNLIFVLTYLCVCYLSTIITTMDITSQLIVCIGVNLVSFVSMLLFSPVKNVHKKITENKEKKYKIISILLFSAYNALSLVLIINNLSYGAVIAMTLAAVSIMIIVEIFMQRRGYHESA